MDLSDWPGFDVLGRFPPVTYVAQDRLNAPRARPRLVRSVLIGEFPMLLGRT